MFDQLYAKAENPELREMIAVHRDSERINSASPNGKAHRAVHAALTFIGNAALDCGEVEVAWMAREMRDENLSKFEEEFGT